MVPLPRICQKLCWKIFRPAWKFFLPCVFWDNGSKKQWFWKLTLSILADAQVGYAKWYLQGSQNRKKAWSEIWHALRQWCFVDLPLARWTWSRLPSQDNRWPHGRPIALLSRKMRGASSEKTPQKINGWNPKTWMFGRWSSGFQFPGIFLRFHLNFPGCISQQKWFRMHKIVLVTSCHYFLENDEIRMESSIELCWIPTTAPPLWRQRDRTLGLDCFNHQEATSLEAKNNKFCCMMKGLGKWQRPVPPPRIGNSPPNWWWKSIREWESKISPSFRSRIFWGQLAQKGEPLLVSLQGAPLKLGGGSAFGTHCGAGGKPSRGALFDQRFVFLHIFFLQIFGPKSLV